MFSGFDSVSTSIFSALGYSFLGSAGLGTGLLIVFLAWSVTYLALSLSSLTEVTASSHLFLALCFSWMLLIQDLHRSIKLRESCLYSGVIWAYLVS